MTDLRNQRRMASSIMKCGIHRVWMDHDRLDEIARAVTKDDVRILVNGKAIQARPKQGISSGRTKYSKSQKEKGRRKGHGSRKGAKCARSPRKKKWIQTIRPIRAYLCELRDAGAISSSIYRRYYLKAKGGEFRNKRHLKTHLVQDGLLKEEVS
jgi:large subunit ribosomal protein L19e